MIETLLRTKLYVPAVRPNLVPRPHLTGQLNRVLEMGCCLALISAPAGSGKTTLLSEWVSNCGWPVGWLSLDKTDNDPFRFLTYLITAIQVIEADIGTGVLEALGSPGGSPTGAPLAMDLALTLLLNEIGFISDPFVIVLDDYHHIDASRVHEAVSFLLDHQPPHMHLVIATRVDPPLSIARMRARGQLIELHAADLSFTPDETATFLNEAMGLTLSNEQVAVLERRTEGWIAGLQLAALSMQGRDDVDGFVKAFSGSHRFILDYLTGEVLNQQPHETQAFLKQTSILDRLNGSLCDAVTERDDGQKMLETLEAANLFVAPLDEERRWYHCHHLFSELLRQRLQWESSDLLSKLHRRASQWYEDNGFITESVSHALASGDPERAADLIDWVGWEVLTLGEMTTVLGWLEALPNDLLRSHPQLGVLYAWALGFTGKLDSGESHLREVDARQVEGEASAFRAYVASARGDVPDTIRYAQKALELLPEEKWFSRGIVALSLGLAYQSKGDLEAAGHALTKAITFVQAAEQTYLAMVATALLGHIQEKQGLLHQAVQTHREALRLASEKSSQPVPFASLAYGGIAEVLYEWNDLDRATHYATEDIELSKWGGLEYDTLASHAILAQSILAQGEGDRALEIIQKAELEAQRYDNDLVMPVLSELRIRILLARGNVATASRWAREHRLSPGDSVTSAGVVEQITVARVLSAQGELGKMKRLLAQLLDVAETSGRMGSVIKILALQALSFQAQGDMEQALSRLKRALSLAEPEGYVRTFVDEGEPMARLLHLARRQGISADYVARLMACFQKPAAPSPPVAYPFVESLSERELELLRLVAEGKSNREIAGELTLALGTVKSHLHNIYQKLDAGSRTQAIVRARKLDLL